MFGLAAGQEGNRQVGAIDRETAQAAAPAAARAVNGTLYGRGFPKQAMDIDRRRRNDNVLKIRVPNGTERWILLLL